MKNITETFRDGTVLITGSTGFVGKLLMEKLLKSCPLKNIAIIVRSKSGITAEERMADIYQQIVFDQVRNSKPDFMKYIKIINGNIEEPSMDLLLSDRNWLMENVNFVFHCAATVKFNEPLALATKINIQGTENLLELAAKMKNLKGFVHVSTAYSHCPRDEIKEQYYPVPVTVEELKNILENDGSTSEILENWPNTYSFTKAVTENLISTNEHHLPISIFRPSIIGCTKLEPYPGWFENMIGPPGIITGIMIGFIRVVLLNKNKVFDLVPADYTVNALISVMWDTVNRHQECGEIKMEPKIYNYVSGAESPLTWDKYIKEMYHHYPEAPPLQSIWYTFNICHTNKWVGSILRFWLHRVPSVLADSLLLINGQKPKAMKVYSKAEKLMDLYYTFSTKEWNFDNRNTQELWLSMSQEEQKLFPFSLKEFDWKTYIQCYYYGIRKYILHEEADNITQAIAKNRKLFWFHNLCVVIFVCIAYKLFGIILTYLY